jgi:hypothetical protein
MTDQWTCGHEAGATCAECYRDLAAKAHDLAEENARLRAELEGWNAAKTWADVPTQEAKE